MSVLSGRWSCCSESARPVTCTIGRSPGRESTGCDAGWRRAYLRDDSYEDSGLRRLLRLAMRGGGGGEGGTERGVTGERKRQE